MSQYVNNYSEISNCSRIGIVKGQWPGIKTAARYVLIALTENTVYKPR